MNLALSHTPRYLGRAPTNDLVFADRAVSSRHAVLFTSGGRVYVEDLGSRNGTFVNGRRVRRRCEMKPGEELCLGGSIRLILVADDEQATEHARLVLEQLDGALRVPLSSGVLRVGQGLSAEVSVLGLRDVVEIRWSGGRIHIGPDNERCVPLGAPFALGEGMFRVVAASPGLSQTAEPASHAPSYQLSVTLSGPTGPRAHIEVPELRASLEWKAPNRVVLLYLLAKKLDAELRAGRSADERGWCSDTEIALGLWGKEGMDRNLNVLVTRIRNDLRAAGLDPWILEKRQAHVRLRQITVEVTP